MPPVNWNAVHTTKIWTILGGSLDKAKDLVDGPSLMNGTPNEIEGSSDQKLGESIVFLISTVMYECKTTHFCPSQLPLWRLRELRLFAFVSLL